MKSGKCFPGGINENQPGASAVNESSALHRHLEITTQLVVSGGVVLWAAGVAGECSKPEL